MRRTLLYAAAGVAAVLTLAQPAHAQQLTGAGSTFIYPLLSKMADAYRSKTGVTINYQSIGSGAGVQQLKAKTVDFGASDAPLSDQEQREMPGPVLNLPLAAGCEAITYNLPGVPGGLKLTGPLVAEIYLGKVTRWNDPRIARLNPGVRLPARAIAVAHRSDGSGTTFIFTDYLAAISPEWKSRVGIGKAVSWPVGIGGKGNEGVAEAVHQTPGGIGYVELAYAIKNRLPYAVLQNKAGRFVAPSLPSTTAAAAGGAAAMKRDIRTHIVNSPSANADPIAGFTYMLVYRNMANPTKAKQLVGFLKWAMTSGQSMAAPLQYAPLPKSVAQINLASISRIMAGGKRVVSAH